MWGVGTETWVSPCDPSRPACTSQHRAVIGALSPCGCLASAPSQGLSAIFCSGATSHSPLESVITGKVNANAPAASGAIDAGSQNISGSAPPAVAGP